MLHIHEMKEKVEMLNLLKKEWNQRRINGNDRAIVNEI